METLELDLYNEDCALSSAIIPFNGTLVQFKSIFAIAGTTAIITLDQAVASGNLLVIMCQFNAGIAEIVSINAGGTFVPVPGLNGASPDGAGMAGGYVYPSVAGGPIITLTFTNSCTANFAVWEIAPTAGVPALDVAVLNYVPSGTNPVIPTATISGTKACVFVAGQTKFPALATAIAAPYTARITAGQLWAEALNVASYTTPSLTTDTGAAITSVSALAFSASPTAFKTQLFCDFLAGVNGADCTAAALHSSSYGWNIGQWTTGGSGAAMKFQNSAGNGLINATGRLNDGVSYAAGRGSTRGVEFLTSTVQSYLMLNWYPGGGSNSPLNRMTAGIWFWSDLPGADGSNLDVFNLNAAGGTGFANCKFLQNAGSRSFELEIPGGSSGAKVNVSSSTWYWLSLEYNRTAAHVLRVYAADGTTLIGTLTETQTGTGMPSYLGIGQSSANTPTTGFSCRFAALKVDTTGSVSPILP